MPTSGTLKALHCSSSRRDPNPEPLRRDERKEREAMSSPFVTVRYPDGVWELSPTEKVPKAGETLRRSDGKWVVSSAAKDTNGHVIVTWRPAPKPAY